MFNYNVGVIGGGDVNDEYCNISYNVGKLLAENNCVVFCGGMGGVMECVSRGVSENNGTVIGILPGNNKNDGNKYLTVKMPLGIGYLRNFFIIRSSDVLIAIDGFSGTTSEAAFALTEGKTVVSIGELDIKEKDTDGKFIKAKSPEEAVEIALKEAGDYILKNR